jgi:hypothetical protein
MLSLIPPLFKSDVPSRSGEHQDRVLNYVIVATRFRHSHPSVLRDSHQELYTEQLSFILRLNALVKNCHWYQCIVYAVVFRLVPFWQQYSNVRIAALLTTGHHVLV